MTELVRVTSLPEQVEFSRVLAASKLLPPDYRGNPANVLFAIQYAEALGVAPIHAITSIHVISGKPSASADLIAGLVRRAGHKLRVQSSDTKAVATIIRADDPDFPYVAEWDMEKAKAAGLLTNPSWKKYPAAMLRSRAITEVARQGASDALFGVAYTPEELGAEVDAHGAPESVPSAPRRVTAADIQAAAEPARITGQQTEQMMNLFREKGFVDRDDRLAYVTEIVGVNVESAADLTAEQADAILAALGELAAVEATS